MGDGCYLWFCDPLQGYSSQQIRALLNLHCVFLPQPVIQDNFLISNVFRTAAATSPQESFSALFSELPLRIALRSESESLRALKAELAEKIRGDKYVHFLTELGQEHLYQDPAFDAYLAGIDLNAPAEKCIRWEPSKLGESYRREMQRSVAKSIETGDLQAIGGLPPLTARGFLDEVDKKSPDGRHSRTAYYNLAAEPANSAFASEMRRWADRCYLTNLPNYLALKKSMPSRLCDGIDGRDPFAIAGELSKDESQFHLEGLNTIVLNEAFLLWLTPGQIATLRSTSEFEEWEQAYKGTDINKARMAFIAYAKAISDMAPSLHPTLGAAIRSLELQKAKLWIAAYGGVLAVANFFTPIGLPLTFLAVTLALTSGTEKKLEKTKDEALAELELRAPRALPEYLADVVHHGSQRST